MNQMVINVTNCVFTWSIVVLAAGGYSDQPRANHDHMADIVFAGDGFIIIAFPEIHTNKGQEVEH